MAYVDRQSGTSRATSIATVAVIHAGLGAVLLYGLATNVILAPEDEPLRTTNIPLPKPPPPPEEVVERDEPRTDSTITSPPTQIDVNKTDWVVDKVPDEIPTEIAIVTPPHTPQIDLPPAKPVTFKIKNPRPANDQSRWVTTEDYPASAIRSRHEGTTKFRVVVSSAGKVQGCEVTGSSGYPALDAAVCKNVTKRAKFEPGSDAQGQKAVGSYSSTVVWRIPED